METLSDKIKVILDGEDLNKELDNAIDRCEEIFNSMKNVKKSCVETNKPEDHVIVCYSFSRFNQVRDEYKKEGLELDLKTHWREVFKYFIESDCLFNAVKELCNLYMMTEMMAQKNGKIERGKILTFLTLEKETREYRHKMQCYYIVCDDKIEEMYKDFVM
jgi:hypothetical protein